MVRRKKIVTPKHGITLEGKPLNQINILDI